RIHEGAFATEVAANERGIDAHHVLGDINALSKLLAHLEWHFAVDPDLYAPAGVQGEHGGMRLNVGLVLVLRAEGMLEDVRRLAKALFDIAVFPGIVRYHVGMFLRPGHTARIAHEIGVQHWRVRAHGLERVEHRDELLVLHLNALYSLLRSVDILGSHGCHFPPREAHDVTRQHGHVAQEAPH